MPDIPEVQSLLDDAAAAAQAGDFHTAEARLRDAADRQERTLGPAHADLANTLNNLAIACEATGKTADAEGCYRRAYEIASVALAPDHPFVTTSRNNLHEFCRARGLPIDVPKPAPPPPPPPAPPPAVVKTEPGPPPPVPARALARDQPAAASRETAPPRFGRVAIAVAIAGVVLLAILLLTRPWSASNDSTDASPATAASSPVETPGPVPRVAEQGPPPPSAAETTAPEARRSAPAAATGTGPASSAVAVAELCRTLSRNAATWTCGPPDSPVSPGRLAFYTRVRSRRATTVQHRWYEGDRLRQSVDLRILANATAGYRTYSRFTIPAGSAGAWRVELRGADGALLHETRFVVR